MHMSRSLQTYSMCGDPIYGVVSPTSLMSWDELQHEFRRHEKHSSMPLLSCLSFAELRGE